MKATTLFLLPAVASAAVLQTRQFPYKSIGFAKLEKITKLAPEVRADAIHQITRFGPYQLRAAKAGKVTDSGQQSFLLNILDGFCTDCTVLKGHAGLQFKDGTPAMVNKGVSIHRILTFDMTKQPKSPAYQCNDATGRNLGARFVGTNDGQNNIPVWYTSRDGKNNGGYFVGPQDSFILFANLGNQNAEEKEVYITMELEYLRGQVGTDTSDEQPFGAGCDGSRTKTTTSEEPV